MLKQFIRFRNFSVTTSLLRYRPERKYIRNYLLNNKKCQCILCNKKYPPFLLEGAHLKPRYLLEVSERTNLDVVELMCLFCHRLYDYGYISVNSDGILVKSKYISKYHFKTKGKQLDILTEKNREYFKYHFDNIFKK